MKSEKAAQSLESQLQMARPRRHEVKRVPLTPEEKGFLGDIMDKAVAAEKAGKLAEAIEFYTDYKNELLKIKNRIEKEERGEIEWTKENLVEWAKDIGKDEKFVEDNFDLTKLPKLETKSDLTLDFAVIDKFPAAMKVNGTLIMNNATIKKWIGTNLSIRRNLFLFGAKTDYLPDNTMVFQGNLDISQSSIKDLPDDIFIGGSISIEGAKHEKKLAQKARELKAKEQIEGEIITNM